MIDYLLNPKFERFHLNVEFIKKIFSAKPPMKEVLKMPNAISAFYFFKGNIISILWIYFTVYYYIIFHCKK